MRFITTLTFLLCSMWLNANAESVQYSPEERAYIQQHRNTEIPFFSVYSRRYEPDAVLVDTFIDILNRDSGLTFNARYDDWPTAYDYVSQQGMAVISRITDLPSRKDTFLFTDSYYERPLFYLTTNEIVCCDEESFIGKPIGSIEDTYFSKAFKVLGALVTDKPTIETLLYELISGRFEGVIADWSDIYSLKRELRETFREELVDKIFIYEVPRQIFTPSRLTFGVNKNDPLLFSIVNKHYEQHRATLTNVARRANERQQEMLFVPNNEAERRFVDQFPHPSICLPFDSPPMITQTPSGELGPSYVGNVLREMQNQLGLFFNFKNVVFEDYITMMTNNECHAFIMADRFADKIGLASTSTALLETEIVLLSNQRDVYYTRPELIQDLNVGSVARLPLDVFNIPLAKSTVDNMPSLLNKLQRGELDALAMIREQAGYLVATHPELGLSVIANAGADFRFVLSAHPRFATVIDILERGLKKIPSGFLSQEYRNAMSLVQVRQVDKTPLIWLSGALLCVILLAAILLTRSRRKAAQSAKLAALQNEFLSNMSHELRTPLNGVYGIFQLLEQEDLAPAVKDLVGVGLDSTRNLSLLINDILDYDKLHQGKVAHKPATVNIRQALQGICKLHRPQASQKGIYIQVNVEDNVPEWLMLDPMRFEQLCNNIVNNAVKFTEKGGLTVNVIYAQDTLKIAFIDSGIGMSKDLQKVLFERFTQGSDNKTNTFRGTGLGMAICKELTALMGGHIEVESTVGYGSTFYVNLPSPKADHQPAPQHQLPPLTGLRVLFCDDEKNITKVSAAMMDKFDVDYTLTENGVDALNMVQKKDFDVILMDINMPVMGGIEFLSDYRRLGGTVPVVAFTANAMPEDIKHYQELGFDNVLTKPIALENLHAILNQYTSK